MAQPVALISSEKIKQEEFRAFLQRLGATGDPDRIYDGVIQRTNGTVWIALNPEDLKNYPETIEEKVLIEQKLGGKAQSCILLDVGETFPESNRLEIDLACEIAKRWPCVLDTLDGENWQVLSAQELCELQTVGAGFNKIERKDQ